MSGSEVVREYRARTNAVKPVNSTVWRKRVIVAGLAASAMGFCTIVVRAADDAGVFEIAKQYNPVRTVVRAMPVPVPRMFVPVPQPMVRTSLSYAPVFSSLMPALPPDTSENRGAQPLKGSPKAVKVSPKAMSQQEFSEAYLSSRTSYCVRSCDGFFFPIGTPESGDLSAHEAACERACPASETSVYVAPSGSKGIEDAVNRRGQRYEALKTAFNHRSQLDNACSCNPVGTPRNYSLMTDFTLRKGDLVMGSSGLRMFKGAERFPLRTADFTSTESARMSADERRTMQKIEAATMRGMAGAQLSPTLKARISEQVNSGKAVATATAPVRTANLRKIKRVDGSEMRYVGPDKDFDRAR